MDAQCLRYISAPMVNQSDFGFRLLTRKYNATLTYTQMLDPQRLVDDKDYLEFHLRDLHLTRQVDYASPVVVQLCGNNPQTIVDGGRKIQAFCDGIDLNLGCPQEHARARHIGGYLLSRKDWPIVESLVGAMSHSFVVPTSAKIRLCQPAPSTVELGRRLEAAGAAWITLHARHVSATRRRKGAADLQHVKLLKDSLSIPVISNGNVKSPADIAHNLEETGADGAMVGESLLRNPCIFADSLPDPVTISLEYLALCCQYPGTATLETIQTHIRHFVEFQCERRPWYKKFRSDLSSCTTLNDISHLLRFKVERWRGRPLIIDPPLFHLAGEPQESQENLG